MSNRSTANGNQYKFLMQLTVPTLLTVSTLLSPASALRRLSIFLLAVALVPALSLSCFVPCVGATVVHKANGSTKTTTKSTTKPTGKTEKEEKTSKPSVTSEAAPESFIDVIPEELVEKPQEYLNKNVKFTGKFFAFSSLALDYKPAFRSSKSYLSFLILRSHSHVPLSELKLALAIPKEKDPENQLIAILKDGDTIELSGRIFSTELGEPWMDVHRIKKIGDSDEKTAEAEHGDKESGSEAGSKAAPEGDTTHSQPKPAVK